MKELIIVGGIPRSGTTLIQNILDCHPSIVGGPEFSFLPNLVQLRRKLIKSEVNGQISFYTDKELIDKIISNSINQLLSGKHVGREKYISEKTPWNILVFEDLLELLPLSKFIFVIRHPYAVFESMYRVKDRAMEKKKKVPDFIKDLTKACYYFESVLYLMNSLNSKYPGKIYTVKYEEILDKPELVTKNMCNYLKLEWNDKMLTPGQFKHPGEAATVNEVWYTKDDYIRNIQKRQGNDGTNLPRVFKRFLDLVFSQNSLVENYGYKFSRCSISLVDNWKAKKLLRSYRKKYDPKSAPIRTL